MDGEEVTTFEPITAPTMIKSSPRTTHVTIVRSGVWKNRINSGVVGRPGKRKERGYKKGFGYGGTPTPPKAYGKRQKEERVK